MCTVSIVGAGLLKQWIASSSDSFLYAGTMSSSPLHTSFLPFIHSAFLDPSDWLLNARGSAALFLDCLGVVDFPFHVDYVSAIGPHKRKMCHGLLWLNYRYPLAQLLDVCAMSSGPHLWPPSFIGQQCS